MAYDYANSAKLQKPGAKSAVSDCIFLSLRHFRLVRDPFSITIFRGNCTSSCLSYYLTHRVCPIHWCCPEYWITGYGCIAHVFQAPTHADGNWSVLLNQSFTSWRQVEHSDYGEYASCQRCHIYRHRAVAFPCKISSLCWTVVCTWLFVFFRNSKFRRWQRFREAVRVTMQNLYVIGRTGAEIWRFFAFQNDGHSP